MQFCFGRLGSSDDSIAKLTSSSGTGNSKEHCNMANNLQVPTIYDTRRYSKPGLSNGSNTIFPKLITFHRSRSWSSSKDNKCSSLEQNNGDFLVNMPVTGTPMNKYGYATLPGVENIDTFLFALRFYGFDLWMNRYAETGKQYRKRNFVTKIFYFAALILINTQMLMHILTTIHAFMNEHKMFYSFLDEVRTFILKFTMTFAVDLWFIRSRRQAAMTHLVVINYLRANKTKVLRHVAIFWLGLMLLVTTIHWALSQYWLLSLTSAQYRKWLNIIKCAVESKWLGDENVLAQKWIAWLDSFVYRMYIYGSRFAVMCAYCLLSMLLCKCIEQVNDILTYHLDNEFHYHHHYCRRARERRRYLHSSYSPQNEIKFNIDHFKRQFTIVYGMHQEIEDCFGALNFIWFGSLFVVSCIDIFFLAWNAGNEWFRVWSLLEFSSMIILWAPHFAVAYCASRVSIQSRSMRLRLKELCRQEDEIRELIISPVLYPRIKPTLNGIVSLDVGFILSFVVTLVTFSVMLIQLSPRQPDKIR